MVTLAGQQSRGNSVLFLLDFSAGCFVDIMLPNIDFLALFPIDCKISLEKKIQKTMQCKTSMLVGSQISSASTSKSNFYVLGGENKINKLMKAI